MLVWLYWDSHNVQGLVDFLNAGHLRFTFLKWATEQRYEVLLEEFIEAIEAQVNRKEKQDNQFLKGEGVGSFFTSFLNKRRRVKRISEEDRIRRQIIFTVRIGLDDITSVLGRFSQPRVWLSPHDVRWTEPKLEHSIILYQLRVYLLLVNVIA